MKWITREHAKVDRVACPWLIKKFIDPEGVFLFVPREQVLEAAAREGALSYDAPGARFTHRDGKCTFEVLVEEYKLADPALKPLSLIVHGADVPEDIHCAPESAGLKAVAEGFAHLFPDDHEKLEREFVVYDALYAWSKGRVSGG